MKTNIEFFNYSKNNPEDILDPFYAKDMVVIPSKKEEVNKLTENNEKMIKLITTFSVLDECYKNDSNEIVQKIVLDIIDILNNTPNINFSAFTQFFMVYNSTFSIYKSLSLEDKKRLVYEMLKKYCKERHDMYMSHGYSNAILQVMCDNYSHKRNSKSGIEKVLGILNPYNLNRLTDKRYLCTMDNYYFLPDKGDKGIFEYMLSALNMKMESRAIEQNKLPDIVFKHNNHYYICELKTMKEGGGGQNKQVVEIAYFIKFSESNPNIHYITFLDCNYSNTLFHDESPKVKKQREDIISALHNNPGNYFLNTKGMIEFLKEVFEDK